jgi:radical SAM superfamily enzyme YgiQ (UPF0313 family)
MFILTLHQDTCHTSQSMSIPGISLYTSARVSEARLKFFNLTIMHKTPIFFNPGATHTIKILLVIVLHLEFRAHSIGKASCMAEQIVTRADKAPAPPRILLIKSPQNDPTWRQITHPLGLMCIAAYLRTNFHYEIKIADIRISGNGRFDLETAIRAYAPDVVGISALTHESEAVPGIAECVKRVNANTPVLLGGPHATAYPDKAIQIPEIDYLVVGEGERAAGRLIECLLHRGDTSDIRGIVFKKDNQIFSTGRAPFIEDLNDLPMPAHDLIDIEAYGHFDSMSRTGLKRYMSIFSSRGCPFQCIYCHNIFGKVFRCRSAENLFNEIKYCYTTYQIRAFEILDDIFNLDRDRLIDFCNRIINSGMKVTFAFPNGLRSDLLDEIAAGRRRFPQLCRRNRIAATAKTDQEKHSTG